MPGMEDNRSARPSLVFRVGITGARNLRAHQLDHVQKQLKAVFTLVKAEMKQLALLKDVTDAYASETGEQLEPRLYLITPLAFGADRMAAQEALDQEYEIFVPMPFPEKVYENDFTGNIGKSPDAKPVSAEEDLAQFRRLLSRASGQSGTGWSTEFGPGRWRIRRPSV